MFPRLDFFSGAKLNFTENLLYPDGIVEVDTACITVTEDGSSETTSWGELREAVRQCSNALRASGVRPGDVVAGFISNHVQALVAMLAAATIGAVWTAISPENGVAAALDRFEQVGPTVLFVDDGMIYNDKRWSSLDKILQIVERLRPKNLTLVVLINKIDEELAIEGIKLTGVKTREYSEFLATYVVKTLSVPSVLRTLPAHQIPQQTLSSYRRLTLSTFFSPVARQDSQKPSFTAHWER